MKKQITKYYCDVCGKEVEKLYTIPVPMVSDRNEFDYPRKYSLDMIQSRELDFCEDCVKKVIIVRNRSGYGGTKYAIVEGELK